MHPPYDLAISLQLSIYLGEINAFDHIKNMYKIISRIMDESYRYKLKESSFTSPQLDPKFLVRKGLWLFPIL